MSASSVVRPSEAVLLTPPRIVRDDDHDDGMVTVEGERCETVDLSQRSINKSSPSANPLLRFFESNFGSENQNQKKATEEKELDDFTSLPGVKLVPAIKRELVGGFDICREYSYSGDEDENNYFINSKPSTTTETLLARDAAEEDVVKTHLLGRVYHPIHDFNARREYESSLFWFTYRCGFPEIMPYNITSDAGWGCTLRAAQMLLAQAFRMHYKSRDWKPPNLIAKRRQDPFVRSILSWFADFPSVTDNLYSIHNMVATGLAKYDKLPGEWYGPGTVCYVLRDLVELHERQYVQSRSGCNAEGANRSSDRRMFRVHVAPQSTVYRDAIEELMTRDNVAILKAGSVSNEPGKRPEPTHPLDAAWEDELVESSDMAIDWDCPLLLLIPLRLGLNSFNEAYVRAVAHTFSLPQSVGGLGGRPRSARWFYGALSDGSKIFGLDPHTVQNAPRKRSAQVNGKSSYVVDLSDEYLRSVHTTYPEVFCLQKMDPSIALGFFCRTRKDLEHVFSSVREWHAENRDSPELFSVLDASPDYSADVSSAMDDMMMSRLAGSLMMDGDESHVSDEDDYVML